eukprot:4793969-Pleurochrysis_carterae.AAC.1
MLEDVFGSSVAGSGEQSSGASYDLVSFRQFPAMCIRYVRSADGMFTGAHNRGSAVRRGFRAVHCRITSHVT